MIYFDSAATSLLRPPCVAQAVLQAMGTFASSSRGAYAASLAAARAVYEARERIAGLFGAADASWVAFTSNVTEALNIALKGLLGPGDGVIATVLDHNSVLRPLYELEQEGVQLHLVGADADGMPDYGAIERLLAEDASIRAVVTTHASNLTGNLVDIHRIGQMCARYDCRFIVDTAQTAGVFPVAMGPDHIDIVAFTGHKTLLGPQGTGGLCVREGVRLRTWKSGGSGIQTFDHVHPAVMPAHLEAGTLNAHGIAGLAAGVAYLQERGIDCSRSRELSLARQFYEGVRMMPEIRLYGDFSSPYRAPIVSLNIGDMPSAAVSDILSTDYEICTRAGGHCAPLMHEHFGTREQGMVRFSFSHLNREEEVAAALQAVREIAAESEQ